MGLERGTTPTRSRRTWSRRYELQSTWSRRYELQSTWSRRYELQSTWSRRYELQSCQRGRGGRGETARVSSFFLSPPEAPGCDVPLSCSSTVAVAGPGPDTFTRSLVSADDDASAFP
jgi:hypothetical protein